MELRFDEAAAGQLQELLATMKQLVLAMTMQHQQRAMSQIKPMKIPALEPPKIKSAPGATNTAFKAPKLPIPPKVPSMPETQQKMGLSVAPQMQRMLKSLRRQK